jgi:hypothetical protein|nr:MAG TPA: hypothetical protein [Caudoviricetes sp.]
MSPDREKKLFEITNQGYDDITYDKQIILKDIYKDADIIRTLNNIELLEADSPPEDYRNKSIFTFLKIPETQSKVKNFICFEINDVEDVYKNATKINKRVIFRTVSHQDDIATEYGIDRQDLLAFLIKDRFNWSTILGTSMKKIYDAGKVAENGYYYRDIYYELITPNNSHMGSYNLLDKDRGRYEV